MIPFLRAIAAIWAAPKPRPGHEPRYQPGWYCANNYQVTCSCGLYDGGGPTRTSALRAWARHAGGMG
jgi:hypothetical protein